MESADRDADQADLDMQRLAEQHKQAESDLQRLQQRLEALSSTPPASAADTQAALARKDEQIQELTAQLEAQKNTIGMMDGLLQVRACPPGLSPTPAAATGTRVLLRLSSDMMGAHYVQDKEAKAGANRAEVRCFRLHHFTGLPHFGATKR